jgi:hypothetical protein
MLRIVAIGRAVVEKSGAIAAVPDKREWDRSKKAGKLEFEWRLANRSKAKFSRAGDFRG